jgi:bacterioferritin (cytochrome b1)
MYSKKDLSDVFQRILKFEQEYKSIYNDCIDKVDDEHSIIILKSISNEELGHIVLVKKLFKIIKEDIPKEASS